MVALLYVGLGLVGFILFELVFATGSSDAQLFVSREAIIVVGVGLLSTALINFPFSQLNKLGGWMKVVFRSRKGTFIEDVVLLLTYSKRMTRDGRGAIEGDVETIQDVFLQTALRLVVNRVDPSEIRVLLKEMIDRSQARHEQAILFFESMAKFSPGLALIGTLAGLVKLLANVSDPKSLGPNMALALVCTFYGVTFSNLVFLPLSGRLKSSSHEEAVHKEQLVEAIVSMANNELPIVVEEKLYMVLTAKDRATVKRKLAR